MRGTLQHNSSLLSSQKGSCLQQFGTIAVRLSRESEQLGVKRMRFLPFTGHLRSPCSAIECSKAVGIHTARCFKSPQSSSCIAECKQHITQELARWRDGTRTHGVLISRIL